MTQPGLPLPLARARNLADLSNAAAARTNLELGTASTHDAGDFDAAGAAAAAATTALANAEHYCDQAVAAILPPDLSGLVPYTGATHDVSLGNHAFTTHALTVTGSTLLGRFWDLPTDDTCSALQVEGMARTTDTFFVGADPNTITTGPAWNFGRLVVYDAVDSRVDIWSGFNYEFVALLSSYAGDWEGGGHNPFIFQCGISPAGDSTDYRDIAFSAGFNNAIGAGFIIKGSTGNFLLGTAEDDGVSKLQVAGDLTIQGTLNASASKGVRLPDYTTIEDPGEGTLAWDYSNHNLKVFNGTSWN
jgi:hypothetical protein